MRCLNSLYVFIIGLGSIGWTNAGSEEAKIVFFHGPTSDVKQIYELNEANEILNHPKFDLNRKTVLYIHGYIESIKAPTVQLIVDAYIKRGTYNILILDWSTLADGLYPTAVRKSSELGPVVGEVFIGLFKKGMQNDLLHIVGHSLGSHLAGQIGRTITEKSGIKLQRISGLDPAFPQYYPVIGGTKAISKNDAILVDIIHTDGGRYGTPLTTGTADFWPNGGTRVQSGCPVGLFLPLSNDDLCSHQRSVALWAESVSNPSSKFNAIRRNSDLLGAVNFKPTNAQMGINCAINVRPGDYDLSTNSAPPYSKPETTIIRSTNDKINSSKVKKI